MTDSPIFVPLQEVIRVTGLEDPQIKGAECYVYVLRPDTTQQNTDGEDTTDKVFFTISPQHGFAHLYRVDPKTSLITPFSPDRITGVGYQRNTRGVINLISVSPEVYRNAQTCSEFYTKERGFPDLGPRQTGVEIFSLG